jgi:hypothetical protein
MQMDPSNTYVLDPSSSKYVVATTETQLPDLFFKVEKEVDRGTFYNAYGTTLIAFGESSGYVHVNDDESTARGFHISQKIVTPFSSVKKDSVQVGNKVE